MLAICKSLVTSRLMYGVKMPFPNSIGPTAPLPGFVTVFADKQQVSCGFTPRRGV
jgi:hypothetical protein